MVKLQNISRCFLGKTVFPPIDYQFDQQGMYLLVGDNGSGKSTLLNILALLDEDYDGTLIIHEQNIKRISSRKREKIRRSSICYLTSMHNLISFLPAKSNRALNCKPKYHFDSIDDKEDVRHLSGGEEILLALSSAFSEEKEIYLLDEITSALDDNHFTEVMKILSLMSKKHLIILASHDPRLLRKRDSTKELRILPYTFEAEA